MTLKDCIDIVDNLKPNQYTIKEKVMWLSFIEEIIINEVLKTHEGYDSKYDNFEGYSEDKLSVPLIVPSPYDRLYTAYLKMKIDGENGETARYNNSAALYNTYMLEFRKHYNKTHLPVSSSNKKPLTPPIKPNLGLSPAEYENLKKDMTFILTEYFSDTISDDKVYDVVNSFVKNNIPMLKGKDGTTPLKGVDYYTEADINELKSYMATLCEKEISKFPVPTKLSNLTDDTGAGIWGVNYAKQSYMSDEAYCDGKGNIITDTYATKKEMESNNQFIDEEFARKEMVYTAISDIEANYASKEEVGNINNAIDVIEDIQNQLMGGASE